MYRILSSARQQSPATTPNKKGRTLHRKPATVAAAIALTVVGLTGGLGAPQAQAAFTPDQINAYNAANPGTPWTPGTPLPGVIIYSDAFSGQNASAAAIPIQTYTNAQGITYNADPIWHSTAGVCDGWIANDNTPNPCASAAAGGVSAATWSQLMTMAQALGAFEANVPIDTTNATTIANSVAPFAANQVVTAYTNGGTGSFVGTVLATHSAIPGTTGHYYTTSVIYAETSCFSGHAYLTDSLMIDGSPDGTTPPQTSQADLQASADAYSAALAPRIKSSGTPGNVTAPYGNTKPLIQPPIGVDPCGDADAAYLLNASHAISSRLANSDGTPNLAALNDPTTKTAAFGMKRVSSPALQVSSATGSATVNLGFSIFNAQSEGQGNDAEYDLPEITDVTPSLDKTFSPAEVAPGQPSILTLTITNTSDLLEKDDWSFTDTLPAGLTVAAPASTTCNSVDWQNAGPDLIATPGGSTVTLQGTLGDGEASCTVTVPVVSTNTGAVYTNDASNITRGAGSACANLDPATEGPCGLLPPTPAQLTVKPASVMYDSNFPADALQTAGTVPVDGTGYAVAGSDAAAAGDATSATVQGNVGDTTTAPVGSPLSVSGYRFMGWNTAPDGSGTMYQADGTLPITADEIAQNANNPSTDPTANPYAVWLYGVWAPETPNVQVAKSVAQTEVPNGAEIDYAITVTNPEFDSASTNLAGPATNVVVTDPVPANTTFSSASIDAATTASGIAPASTITAGPPSWTIPTLGVGEQAVFDIKVIADATGPTASLVYANNTASASWTDPNDGTPNSTDSPQVQTQIDVPSIEVAKTGSIDTTTMVGGSAVAGQTQINYTVVATNTGNASLTDVTIADPKVSAWTSCTPAAPTTLAPGATITCDGKYTLTQADIDSTQVVNTATATGTPPGCATGDSSCQVTGDDTITTNMTLAPAITVVKVGLIDQGTLTDGSAVAGQTKIDYSAQATNTGNTTLSHASVTDPMSAQMPDWVCDKTDATLAPGDKITCTGTYTLTQADINAGTVANTATADGKDPAGTDVTSDDPITTEVPQGPAITVKKSATPDDAAHFAVGQVITYTVTATNTGNVTLSNVNVSDPLLPALTCDKTTLAPSETSTCTGTYTLTQTDVDAGSRANTATGKGTDPTGTQVTDDDTVTIPSASSPGITVVKVGLIDQGTLTDGFAVAGQTKVDYSVQATNSGNVTLTNVSVTDPMSAQMPDWACDKTDATLAPGDKITCTGTYTLTQADIDTGTVANTATADGKDAKGHDVTGTDTVTVDEPQNPAITVVKTGKLTGGSTAGATIAYTVTATNTGNVTLTDVVVTDALVPALSCDRTTLAPSESTTCTGTYTVKQSDVDAGQVVNTASVDAKDPAGGDVTGHGDVTTDLNFAPSLDVVKSGALADDAKAGQSVNYQVVATNTGNVTLTNVTVTDPKVTGLVCGGNGVLIPGASITCQGSYVLTQADVDAGSVVNTATVHSKDPSGADVGGQDTVTVDVPPAPSISLAKSATPDDSANYTLGQVITYSFVATNTGNVTLSGVTVTDPLAGLSQVACPTAASAWMSGQVGVLAPGDQVVCTATYTLQQSDIDEGRLANTATATGTPPTGADVTGQDSLTLPETQVAALTLVKTAATVDGADAAKAGANPGATINYTLTGTNTGNVTLTDVVITDDMSLGDWTCDHGATDPILPGMTVTCTGSYVVPATGVTSVVNNATITGQPLDPNSPTPKPVNATVTVPVHQPPTATPQTDLITVSTDTGSSTTSAVLDGAPQPGSAPINYALTTMGPVTALSGDASAVTVTIDPATGKITVTSTQPGVYEIPVTYTDANGMTVTITHQVTVIAPDAATTSANANKLLAGRPVSIPVLIDDGSGSGLTVAGNTPPANGTVTVNPDGTLTYTPNPGYSGPDSFTYTAQDGHGDQAVTTVKLMVTPVASPDSGTTKVDTPLVIPGTQLLGNDSGTGLTIRSVPAAGEAGYPANGKVTRDSTGAVTYTPNPGYSGPDSFTYTAVDQFGQPVTTTVNIMVTPSANPDQITVPYNSTDNVVNVTGNDRGTKLVPVSVPTKGDPGAPAHGSVKIVNGQVQYTPDAGYTGQDTFTYTVKDASGQLTTSTVTITVTAAPIPTYVAQTGGTPSPTNPWWGLVILLAAIGIAIGTIGFRNRYNS